MTTDWDWTIDPMGLRFCCREITSRYGLPIVISENGLGAFDKRQKMIRFMMNIESIIWKNI